MITSKMVEHIKDKLNGLTNGNNTNFGKNIGASEPEKGGILVVLTDKPNLENLSIRDILASSTVLTNDVGEVFTTSSKTINVMNIPYSETISVGSGTATGFALVEVGSDNLISKDIVGSGTDVTSYNKYVINTSNLNNVNILFSGSLSSNQAIEDNNSFSLSNIKITFN